MSQFSLFDDELYKALKAQRSFMDYLVEKGKLFNPDDFAITQKESQKVLRELAGFFLEEISEAYEEWAYLLDGNSVLLYQNPTAFKESLQAFNLELADALAFLLEMWLFLGINQNDIQRVVGDKLEELEVTYNDKETCWKNIFTLAHLYNQQWGFYSLVSARDTVLLPLIPDIGDKPHEYQAGRRLHVGNKTLISSIHWSLTNEVLKTLSNLKAKPWRESEVDLPELKLKEAFIVDIGLSFFQILDLYGATQESTFLNYITKNEINFQRQKEGY